MVGVPFFLLCHVGPSSRMVWPKCSRCSAGIMNLPATAVMAKPPTAAAAAVERLQGELSALELRCAKLEESVFAGVAARYAGSGDVLLFEDEMSGDSVRRLCDAVAETCGGRCAVFAGADGAYKYAIGCTGGKHRSVTLANQLYNRLKDKSGYGLKIAHRDVGQGI